MAILIDAHVHIYPEFSISQLIEAAFINFAEVDPGNGGDTTADYALFLTEGGNYNVFADLHKRATSGDSQQEIGLHFLQTGEQNSLIVQKNRAQNNSVPKDIDSMYVFPGRQYVSKENIELLGLFVTQHIEDKSLTLEELYHSVVNSGGIAVIPWGVGKWLGKRGKVLKNLLDCSLDTPFFLGDNGNRPWFWPTPGLLRYAQKKQIAILSGSDPLPLASHCNRAASSGTLLKRGELSKTHPAESLHKQLNNSIELIQFGRRMKAIRFFCDQYRLIF